MHKVALVGQSIGLMLIIIAIAIMDYENEMYIVIIGTIFGFITVLDTALRTKASASHIYRGAVRVSYSPRPAYH